jgi:hypothetical protein
MKYLIIECNELGDQWECDADRTPICITENPSEYGVGYEVCEILSDGTLKKIRDYDEALEEGMALYYWEDGQEGEEAPTIIEKYPNKDRDSFSKSFFKKLKARVKFSETVADIECDILRSGAHGETIEGKWVVFGEYRDNRFDFGY